MLIRVKPKKISINNLENVNFWHSNNSEWTTEQFQHKTQLLGEEWKDHPELPQEKLPIQSQTSKDPKWICSPAEARSTQPPTLGGGKPADPKVQKRTHRPNPQNQRPGAGPARKVPQKTLEPLLGSARGQPGTPGSIEWKK